MTESKLRIAGRWVGEYSYFPNDSMPALPTPTGFVLDAAPGWFGRFRGTIQDDSARGVRELARMTGRVCGASVLFRKRYPQCYVSYQGKSMTLAEQLRMTHGIDLDRSPPTPTILYRGRYDPREGVVKGTWLIKKRYFQVEANGQPYRFASVETSGEWSMRRMT